MASRGGEVEVRLSALVILYILPLKRIFLPGHRDSLLCIQFVRTRSSSISLLYINYLSTGPTRQVSLFFLLPSLPLPPSPSLPCHPCSLRPGAPPPPPSPSISSARARPAADARLGPYQCRRPPWQELHGGGAWPRALPIRFKTSRVLYKDQSSHTNRVWGTF